MSAYDLHVPVEQYGFVATTVVGDPEDACAEYKAVQRAFRMGKGLDSKRFNAVVDEYMNTGKLNGGAEYWEDMSDVQRIVINEIKKSFKRIKEK